MGENEKVLYLIAGANGCGKSTLASELLPAANLAFVNADDIARELCPECIESVKVQAGKIVIARIDELIKSGISFAIETTLSGKIHLKTIKKAKELGYRTVLLYAYLDNPYMCEGRVKIRVLNGGHDIPHDDIVRRFYRSKNLFWYEYKNIVDEWGLYYNGEPQYVPVAKFINSRLEIYNELLYNSFRKAVEDNA